MTMRLDVRFVGAVIAAAIIIVGLVTATYIVPPGRAALVLRGGKVAGAAQGQGLHWKLPLLESVVVLDRRVRLTPGHARRPGGAKGTGLDVGYTLAWKITAPQVFYDAAGGDAGAAATRLSAAATRAINELAAGTSVQAFLAGPVATVEEHVTKALAPVAAKLGVQVLGLQMGTLKLPAALQERVGTEMAAAVQSQAEAARLQGVQEGQDIAEAARAERRSILDAAEEEAGRVRGQGAAQAASIYAAAAAKSPDFFAFYMQLEDARSQLTSGRRVLVISTDSPLYRALGGAATPSGH